MRGRLRKEGKNKNNRLKDRGGDGYGMCKVVERSCLLVSLNLACVVVTRGGGQH